MERHGVKVVCPIYSYTSACTAFTDLLRIAFTDSRHIAFTNLLRITFTDSCRIAFTDLRRIGFTDRLRTAFTTIPYLENGRILQILVNVITPSLFANPPFTAIVM